MLEEVIIRPNGSKRIKMHCTDVSKTRQEFKNECDLAMIIKRFSKTAEGMKALENARGYLEGRFNDVSSVPDYQVALNQVIRAGEVFGALPAILRTRFDNDPAKFIKFVDNPENLEELRTLGLVKPKVQAIPKENEVAGT